MHKPETVKAYRAAYYKANREKSRAKGAAWRKANLEQARANDAAYYKANREKFLAKAAAWGKANREKCRASIRRWFEAHPEKRRAYKRRRDAIKIQACPLWARNDPRVEALYFIRDWLEDQGEDVHVDHIFPLNPRGPNNPRGLHVYANLRIIDAQTNASKGNRQPTEDEITASRWLL
jgi:hypothetical protein